MKKLPFQEEIYYPEVVPDQTQEWLDRTENTHIEETGRDKRHREMIHVLREQNEINKERYPKVLNERWLILNLRTGTLTFRNEDLTEYEGKLGISSNAFKVLEFLMKNPLHLFTAEDLEDKLNDQRVDGVSSLDRRVRDSLKEVRKKLKIPTQVNFFRVQGSKFGVECNIAFEVESPKILKLDSD